MRSFVRVNNGEVPRENSTEAVTTTQNPVAPSTWVNIANPTAATSSPAPISGAGPIRRTMIGVTLEPTTNARAHGSVHSPASSGESPRTSWRYCGRKRNAPNTRRIPTP